MNTSSSTRRLLIAAGVSAALLLPACSGDDADDGEASGDSGDDSAQSVVTTAAADPSADPGDAAAASSDLSAFENPNFGEGCAEFANPAGTFEEMLAEADGPLGTFAETLDAAGLTTTVSVMGQATVFAPTNGAFDALPEGSDEELMADPTGELQDILKGHVSSSNGPVAQLLELEEIPTLAGSTLPITAEGDTLMIGEASVVCGGVPSANGTVFVIDSVLMP